MDGKREILYNKVVRRLFICKSNYVRPGTEEDKEGGGRGRTQVLAVAIVLTLDIQVK